MATSTKQSTQCSNMAATTSRVIRWNTGFEKRLAKFGQPAVVQAFQIAAATTLSETGLYPYSFLGCFRMLLSFEEQM